MGPIVSVTPLIAETKATSALDNRAQAIVATSLQRIRATRIVVAHRLSTVVAADRIVVLDGGRVAASGTYAELMKEDGLFARLAARQMPATSRREPLPADPKPSAGDLAGAGA